MIRLERVCLTAALCLVPQVATAGPPEPPSTESANRFEPDLKAAGVQVTAETPLTIELRGLERDLSGLGAAQRQRLIIVGCAAAIGVPLYYQMAANFSQPGKNGSNRRSPLRAELSRIFGKGQLSNNTLGRLYRGRRIGWARCHRRGHWQRLHRRCRGSH